MIKNLMILSRVIKSGPKKYKLVAKSLINHIKNLLLRKPRNNNFRASSARVINLLPSGLITIDSLTLINRIKIIGKINISQELISRFINRK